MKFFLMLFSLILVLSGCAYIAQKVDLQPRVTVNKSNLGLGKKVYLIVKDERADTGIGFRGAGLGNAAKITSTSDVRLVFEREIADGLKNMGFEIINEEVSDAAKLKVEIRLLEYTTSTGFWTGGVQTKASLKVNAFSAQKSEYEQLYRVDEEKRVMIVPTMEENAKDINNIASNVLLKMFQDSKLFSKLTE